MKLGPVLDPEKHVAGNWSEFSSVDSVWGMILGFFNATQVSFGGNRSDCQFAMENMVDSCIYASLVLLEKWPNYFNVLRAFDSFLVVPYEIYNVTASCYYGVLEMHDLLNDYFIWRDDGYILAFNIGYNLGAIITNIKNIWMWNVAKDYTRV